MENGDLPAVWFGGNVKNTLARAIEKDAERVRIGKVQTEDARLRFFKEAAALIGFDIEYPGDGDDLYLMRNAQGALRPRKRRKKKRQAPASDSVQYGLELNS